MFTKALSSFAVPRVASEIKTKTNPSYKRATVMPRAGFVKRSRSFGSAVPYLSIAALAAIVFLFGFHLFMVNAYASKGFELKKHEQAVKDLDDQQKDLLVKQSELGSISKVNDVASIYGLVPVTNEEFLNSSQLTQK